MSSLAIELDRILQQVDQDTAQALERAVRDALASAKLATERRSVPSPTADALGYPTGYFESTAGSFAGEPLDAPAELPLQSRESW